MRNKANKGKGNEKEDEEEEEEEEFANGQARCSHANGKTTSSSRVMLVERQVTYWSRLL